MSTEKEKIVLDIRHILTELHIPFERFAEWCERESSPKRLPQPDGRNGGQPVAGEATAAASLEEADVAAIAGDRSWYAYMTKEGEAAVAHWYEEERKFVLMAEIETAAAHGEA